MKRNFNKIIALILAIASLVSMLTVFAYAEDGAGEEVVETVKDATLFYNRGYEEGWDVDNGFTLKSSHSIAIDYEENSDKSYNYFTRITAENDINDGYARSERKAYRAHLRYQGRRRL